MSEPDTAREYIRGKNFVIEPFQESFYNSYARFPGFIGGWGTGKTTNLILKGITLSYKYPGNKGMIFRKTERSLRESTISDFTEYTSFKVPKTNPVVEIPGSGGSTIIFGHADDMRGLTELLQNINLGWIGIEQAEELQTQEVFDHLRGRLRRILTPLPVIQKKLVELGIIDRVYQDWRELDGDVHDAAVDALTNVLHEPYQQFMIIANACGHNWIWKRWIKERWPGYEVTEANSFANKRHIRKVTLDDWERLKLENPRKYARMVMNSHEDYDREGAFYAGLMSDALKAGRVELDTLYDENTPVYTFWDLGVRASDTTAIWFVQFMAHEIWLVDYHESHSQGMNFYSHMLDQKPYRYAAHYLPPDAVQRMQGSVIEVRYDVMKKLRSQHNEAVRLVERHRVEERIAATRGMLNRCKFNQKCEKGVNVLNNYRKKKYEGHSTEDIPVFGPMPDPRSPWRNGADAFGYMAVVYRYQKPDDDAFDVIDEDDEYSDFTLDNGVQDLLKV